MPLIIIDPLVTFLWIVATIPTFAFFLSSGIKGKRDFIKTLTVILGSFFFSGFLCFLTPFEGWGVGLVFLLFFLLTVLLAVIFSLFKKKRQKINVFFVLLFITLLASYLFMLWFFCASLGLSYTYRNKITGIASYVFPGVRLFGLTCIMTCFMSKTILARGIGWFRFHHNIDHFPRGVVPIPPPRWR